MAKVKIMFSGDVRQIGKTRTVPDEDAAVMVREGRAVYVAEPPPEAEPAPAPEPQPTRGNAPQKV